MAHKEPKEIKQPEKWYRLDLSELVNRKKEFKLSGYYSDMNVAIVIGENEGYGGDFKLTETKITPKNKFVGNTENGSVVALAKAEEAKALALKYISRKLTCASRVLVGLNNVPLK